MILFLNDVAGSEVLLIVVFILIFFGSKSIPGIARTVGRTLRQIQNASSDIQNEIKKTAGEYTKELNIDSILKETAQEVSVPLDQAVNDLENSVQYKPKTQKIETQKIETKTNVSSKTNNATDNNQVSYDKNDSLSS